MQIKIKTPEEIKIMAEGGKKLGRIKNKLAQSVKEGANAKEIEDLAVKLIKKEGGKPSFKMVPDYYWATCVNVNDGVVHGIPKKEIVFRKNDLVSIDVGIFYKGFHTDTSVTVGISLSKERKAFLEAGKEALKAAIKEAKVGNRIYDISEKMEKIITKHNLSPVRALVGHGVGRKLHEEPQIPCFVATGRENTPEIPEGAVLAIEAMYTKGDPELVLEKDEWTIATRDGKIASLFEETVAVTASGPLILTEAK